MTQLDDSGTDELLALAQQGDSAARSQLLERYRSQLKQMVAIRLDRRLVPRIDPSDVVQEALTEAAQKLTDYLQSRPVPYYPWLRRLTWEHLVRLHAQHFTARRRSVLREQIQLTDLPDDSTGLLVQQLARSDLAPDRRLLKAESKSQMVLALAQLPDDDRELLVLRFLEHLSTRQIAEVMSLSEGAVRVKQSRALTRLEQLLSRIHRE